MGGIGVSLIGSGEVTNLGTILGGEAALSGPGFSFRDGGTLVNGAFGHSATVGGSFGVVANGSAATTIINYGLIQGAVKSVRLYSASDRVVAEAGATFIGAIVGGGGTLELAAGYGSVRDLNGIGTITGGFVSAQFLQFGDLVIDAGTEWRLTQAYGTLTSTTDLTNDGTLLIDGSVGAKTFVNNGVISTSIYTELLSAVTGSGSAVIAVGGSLTCDNAFNQSISFTPFAGVYSSLTLAKSQSYTATISGFSATGESYLILRDIAFVSPNEASFSGDSSGGVLTVSDAAHTARIHLAGDYLGATFSVGGYGSGVIITANTGSGAATHAFAAAMAQIGGGSAAHLASTPVKLTPASLLSLPRA